MLIGGQRESCSINRHVISGSIVKHAYVVRRIVCGEDTKVVGFNTDAVYWRKAIYWRKPCKVFLKRREVEFTPERIGEAFQDEVNPRTVLILRRYRS